MCEDEMPDLRVLMAKLARLHGLSDDDGAALGRLPVHEAVVAMGQDVVRAGDPADRCAIVLEGLAFGYKLTGDGRRQILCFHLAGDMPDLQSLRFGRADTGVGAVTGCRVGYVPYARAARPVFTPPGPDRGAVARDAGPGRDRPRMAVERRPPRRIRPARPPHVRDGVPPAGGRPDVGPQLQLPVHPDLAGRRPRPVGGAR